MPEVAPEVAEIADLMFRHKLKAGKMAKRAGFRPATWSGWANGVQPSVANVRKFRLAVEAAIAEKTPNPEGE